MDLEQTNDFIRGRITDGNDGEVRSGTSEGANVRVGHAIELRRGDDGVAVSAGAEERLSERTFGLTLV